MADRRAPVWSARDLRAGAAADRGPLLLDTHIWIEYLEGNAAAWPAALRPLLAAAAGRGALFVSDASVWEVAMAAARGRLPLSLPADVWLTRAEGAPGLRFAPLDRPVLRLAPRLGVAAAPGAAVMHKDPFDRLLVATAQLGALSLVTRDALILAYAAAHRGTPCCDAR